MSCDVAPVNMSETLKMAHTAVHRNSLPFSLLSIQKYLWMMCVCVCVCVCVCFKFLRLYFLQAYFEKKHEVGVGWLCRCSDIVWEAIRKRAHTQLVREHSVTVVSARWATVDWSLTKERNLYARANHHLKKKKKRRRGMNCRTFSQNPLTREKWHHHHQNPPFFFSHCTKWTLK